MVVDDDATTRSIFTMFLAMWGVTPLIFQSGEEAAEWLDQVERGEWNWEMPEVALIDLRLPGIMGHAVGQRMREVAATRSIPLIIMSAYYLDDADRLDIHGAARPDLILAKPLPLPDAFRALIEDTIAACADRRNQLGAPQGSDPAKQT
jgi:CheY-like chemotaxis protein